MYTQFLSIHPMRGLFEVTCFQKQKLPRSYIFFHLFCFLWLNRSFVFASINTSPDSPGDYEPTFCLIRQILYFSLEYFQSKLRGFLIYMSSNLNLLVSFKNSIEIALS